MIDLCAERFLVWCRGARGDAEVKDRKVDAALGGVTIAGCRSFRDPRAWMIGSGTAARADSPSLIVVRVAQALSHWRIY